MDSVPFKNLIQQHCGLRFNENTEDLLISAIEKRIAQSKTDDVAAYYQRLQTDQHELHELVSLLTINETYFFREPEHLSFLVERLIPRLLVHKQDDQPLRILSAGCSTGEEPYSIAIALQEKYGETAARLFTIIAGDIDKAALNKARAARYVSYSFRGLGAELRDRYFDQHDSKTWHVKKAVRDSVKFHQVNLLSESLATELQRFDVIFFRNVSIYFDEPTRRQIQHNLAALLKKDGYLLVGSSETLGNDLGALVLVAEEGQFYFTHQATQTIKPPANANAVDLRSLIQKPISVPLSQRERVGVRAKIPDISPSLSPSASIFSPHPNTAPAASEEANNLDQALRLTREKRYDEAMQIIAAWLSQQPSNQKALLLKAHILLNRREFAAADEAAQQVLEIDAWSIDACLLCGLAAKWREQTDVAIKWFKQAVYACHSCWPAHYYLAEIYRAHHQIEKSRRAYRIVLQMLTTQPESQDGLSVIPLDLPPAQVRFLCEHQLAQLDRATVGAR